MAGSVNRPCQVTEALDTRYNNLDVMICHYTSVVATKFADRVPSMLGYMIETIIEKQWQLVKLTGQRSTQVCIPAVSQAGLVTQARLVTQAGVTHA